MHRLCPLALFLSLVCLTSVSARLQDGRLHANMMRTPGIPLIDPPEMPVVSRNGTVLPPYNTTYYFDQLIDHDNPSLGTFKQRFWHTYEFYEPGGPIILQTPGETNADGYSGYLTNKTVPGLIAQQQNGSIIILEHRFYGFSNPYPDLSVESFRVHTIQQAIDDLEYFAINVHLPMPGGDQVTPDKAPWILLGGSYAGALTSWTMVNKPGLFFAGYASSGVVEAIVDFWKYFEPIRQNMPANCSADVQAVIAHVDETFTKNNATAIQALKESFHMGNVVHLDDVAGALRNNLWDWQSLQVTSGPGAQFFNFCDALEVKDGVQAPSTGWGLDHALNAWGSYWRDFYFTHICGTSSEDDCIGTYNTSLAFWTDTSINNSERSWLWIICNKLGYFQDGAPPGTLTLVTRLIQPAYDMRQCEQMFPGVFRSSSIPNASLTNKKYKGWNVKVDHLFFANGVRDPWKDATISADGTQFRSTPFQPIALGDGFHCSDLGTASGIANPTIAAVQAQALFWMNKWLETWKPAAPWYTVSSPSTPSTPQTVSRMPHAPSKPISAWFKPFGTF
ncbi:hypothetical protein BYT27DRAFT_6649057 [Phlegmacium glaucopus]|nr:hypothetical protein BYT27DRAFT_6649057 [Phlegmacium glaucopus]